MREKVLEEAKRVFKPEFLNRISDIVFFRPLDKADLVKIVELEVGEVRQAAGRAQDHARVHRRGEAAPDREGLRREVRRPARCAARSSTISRTRWPRPSSAATSRRASRCRSSRDGDRLIFMQKTPPTAAPAAS